MTTDDRDNAAPSGFVQAGPESDSGPIVVDARGHRCPVPTLRLRRALERVPEGRIIRLLADDPLARIDVPHFCASEGCRLLSSAEDGGTLVFEVTR